MLGTGKTPIELILLWEFGHNHTILIGIYTDKELVEREMKALKNNSSCYYVNTNIKSTEHIRFS